VVDIRVMHTTIDLGDRLALIPSNSLMTQVILRRRRTKLRFEWEEDSGSEHPDAQ
jgi:hypothetical protein